LALSAPEMVADFISRDGPQPSPEAAFRLFAAKVRDTSCYGSEYLLDHIGGLFTFQARLTTPVVHQGPVQSG
jgi:hypothetical protein